MLFALMSAAFLIFLAMFAFDVLRIGPHAGRFGMAIDRSRLQEVAATIRDRMRRDE
jgi:hypothetical protein